jgi:hypothetical protein
MKFKREKQGKMVSRDHLDHPVREAMQVKTVTRVHQDLQDHLEAMVNAVHQAVQDLEDSKDYPELQATLEYREKMET